MLWCQDLSGLWHVNADLPGGCHVGDAIELVLTNPLHSPAWFWFNGTPAPVFANDSAETLYRRWSQWREAYQTGDARQLFACLVALGPPIDS